MYSYELRSINIMNLPQREAAQVIDRFAGFLDSLSRGVTFYVMNDVRDASALAEEGKSYIYTTPYKRFFVESPEPIDPLIGRMAPKYVRVPSVPLMRLSTVLPDYALDDESNLVKAYSVTKLGGSMRAGFLNELYPLTHTIKVDVVPLDQFAAKKLALSRARYIDREITIRQIEGKSVDPEEVIVRDRANEAAVLMAAGQQKLFKLRMTIYLKDKTFDGLKESAKKLRQVLGTSIGEIDSPRHMQKPILTGAGPDWATGRWFFASTATATTFIPFAGLDIIDPKGVFFGQNLQTGNAVVYDLFEKENYNVAIMGTTGFGKSAAIKTVVSRMASLPENRDMMIIVFDSIVKPEYGVGPDGTLENSFAGLTGCFVKRFTGGGGAGLDPFKVLPDRRMAGDFIMSIVKFNEEREQDLITRIYDASDHSDSVEDLIGRTDGDLRLRLETNLKPYRFLFDGELELYDRMVFVLYDIPSRKIRDAATFLSLSAVWNAVKEEQTKRRKVIVVDEGWALVETDPSTGKPYFPLAVAYVPEIVRTGRHHNACFVISTQRVADLLGSGDTRGTGRAVIESCATKFLLRQDQAASAALKEAFALSQQEEDFILNADIGHGLLLTGEGHVPFYNLMSPYETKIFTTKPSEVGA